MTRATSRCVVEKRRHLLLFPPVLARHRAPSIEVRWSERGVDHQPERRVFVRLKARVGVAPRAILSPQHFGTRFCAANFVRLPPSRELTAPAFQTGDKVDEGGIVGPQIMRHTKLRDHSPRRLRPGGSKQATRIRVGEHEEQDVAVRFLHAREIADDCGCRLVPTEYIPALTGDISRPRQARDDAANRVGDCLARERLVLGNARESTKVGMLPGAETERACERIDRCSGRRSGPALLNPDVPINADAGAFRHLLASQPGRAAAAQAGQAERFGAEPLSSGAQKIAERRANLGVCHPRIIPVLDGASTVGDKGALIHREQAMKAAILREFGKPLTIEALPDPVPGAGELVVDVLAAPVLSYANEVFANIRPYALALPMAPGCGAIGRVRATGPDATRLEPGDWVFCDPTVRSRDDAVTPDIMLQGWTAPSDGAKRLQAHFRHGAFAEQMLLPLESAFPLGALEPAEAPRWCALVSALVPYGGLLAAGLQPGQTVLISGATGHFGSAGIAVALAMGAAAVIAPGRNKTVLADLAARFGPRVYTVDLSGDEVLDRARMQDVAPGPIDCVLDILPPLADAAPVRAAAMTVRAHGAVVLMGGLSIGLELPYRHLMRNNITIRGQWLCPRDAVPRLVALVRAGLLSLDAFIVSEFPLASVNEAVAHAAAAGGPFRLTVIGAARTDAASV